VSPMDRMAAVNLIVLGCLRCEEGKNYEKCSGSEGEECQTTKCYHDDVALPFPMTHAFNLSPQPSIAFFTYGDRGSYY